MSNAKLTMKSLPPSERPYEKLEKRGAGALSDAELLAIVLRSGTKEERVTEVAYRLLTEAGRLSDKPPLTALLCRSLSELRALPGIGRVRAVQLKAILEMASRISSSEAAGRFQAEDPESVAARYMDSMRFLSQETVRLLFLDNRNRYIAEQDISVGSINRSFFSPRDIFVAAMEHKAVNLIVLHNHPSGDPTPSPADYSATKRLVECGELLDIHLMDHIVIGQGQFFSMREHGIL